MQSKIFSDAASSAVGGSWLIIGGGNGLASALAEQFAMHGLACHMVQFGSQTEQLSARHWQIDLRDEGTYSRLLTTIHSREEPLAGVIHLGSLEAADSEHLTSDDFATAAQTGVLNVLALVKAMVSSLPEENGRLASAPRLWLVSIGDVRENVSVGQTPLWGLGRVVNLEQPQLFGGLVDLPPDEAPDQHARRLVAQFLAGTDEVVREDQVALRGNRRYVARLIRAHKTAVATRSTIHPDATYLITGGTGALGRHVARWLVMQGAGHLVRASRSGIMSEEVQKEIDELIAGSCAVLVAKADVARRDDAERLYETIRDSMPPLKGILHAAGTLRTGAEITVVFRTWGTFLTCPARWNRAPLISVSVLNDGVLTEQKADQFMQVMAPKVLRTSEVQ